MIKKTFLIVGLFAFTLNLLWEFSHYFLYVDLSGIQKYPHLVLASFVDMLLILSIFALISFKNKNIEWMRNPRRRDFVWVILSGIFIAAIIEIINLKLERLEYTSAMPTFFGIGMSPLIQLALTGVISLLFSTSQKNTSREK